MRDFAIIIDSGTDVPKELIEKYNMYVLPLQISFSDGDFLDGVTITDEEVCARFEKEIPKTSLPSLETIEEVFNKVKNDGYKKAFVVTISSGLSGTFNAVKMVGEDIDGIDVCYVDTKNIGIGAGFSVVAITKLIDKGRSFEEIRAKITDITENTKVYFCLDTLEYLKKGGRIGLVAGTIGQLAGIKPIISCNEDGIYYTVAKCRGRKNALKKLADVGKEFADNFDKVDLAVANMGAIEETEGVKNRLKEIVTNKKEMYFSRVSPALLVHTGPGIIGIVVQKSVD